MLIPKGQKPKRIKRTKRKYQPHLAWVSRHPCCVCGGNNVSVHHLIHYRPEDKIGRRDDKYVIPICKAAHDLGRGVHGPDGEIDFLESRGVNGIEVALRLYEASPFKDKLQ
jgi:hypothetical protein